MFERMTFREVAELLPDAVVMTDAEGRIVWTNQAFHDLCGHSRASVKNQKPGSFLQGPDTNPDTVDLIRQAIRNRQPVEAEILNYHSKGRPYWVSLRIIPVRNDSGELEGFLAVEREVTDSRSEKNQLEFQIVELYSTLLNVVEDRSLEAGNS